MDIKIVDCQLGNLYNLKRAFQAMGYDAEISRDLKLLSQADKLVFPGVGHFSTGCQNLSKYGLTDVIHNHITLSKPFLGICLGMQLLFHGSKEAEGYKGLSILDGHVEEMQPSVNGAKLPLPEIGWNTVCFDHETPLLSQISNGAYFYFAHKYYVSHKTPFSCAKTVYGENHFASVVQKNHVFGCQFHPEISGTAGLQFLSNFASC